MLNTVTRGLLATPQHLTGHGARRGRLMVRLTIANARVRTATAHNRAKTLLGVRSRINAMANRVLPTRPPHIRGITASTRGASGGGPVPRTGQEQGVLITGAGRPLSRIPAALIRTLPSNTRAGGITTPEGHALVGRVEFPSGQDVQARGRHNAPAVQGTLPRAITVDGKLPVLDGVRIALNGKRTRKHGTRRRRKEAQAVAHGTALQPARRPKLGTRVLMRPAKGEHTLLPRPWATPRRGRLKVRLGRPSKAILPEDGTRKLGAVTPAILPIQIAVATRHPRPMAARPRPPRSLAGT